MQMAMQFLQMGRLEEAAVLCRQILASDPKNLAAIRLLTQIYARQGNVERLIQTLRQMEALDSENPDIPIEIGLLLQDCGRLDEARDSYIRAITINPRSGNAYHRLAMVTTYSAYTDEVADMESLYSQKEVPDQQRRSLSFALGKVFNDLGEYDKAFEYFRVGNKIAYRESGYSIEAAEQTVAKIREAYDASFFRRHRGSGCADRTPIFVTGMPRSGTTLVEQILSSHPQVYGAGEIPVLGQAIKKCAPGKALQNPKEQSLLDDGTLLEISRTYLAGLRSLADGEEYVTDKSIANLYRIGLIYAMLPNATIIHCRRDPRDQGLSLFQKDMRSQPYGYDLECIGRNYRMCSSLIEHWRRFLHGKIHIIRYETLVAEPEDSIRRLLEHCELPYDESCLSFHKTRRVVQNASMAQVRKPIYKGSVGSWKNYAHHLTPLIAALGEDWR